MSKSVARTWNRCTISPEPLRRLFAPPGQARPCACSRKGRKQFRTSHQKSEIRNRRARGLHPIGETKTIADGYWLIVVGPVVTVNRRFTRFKELVEKPLFVFP